MDKWISVKDRLPDEGAISLVYYRRGEYETYVLATREWLNQVPKDAVVDWMPLPEPPEVKDENNHSVGG